MSRVLDILGLFREREAPWTVEALAREIDASVSSTYRDVQALAAAGFLGAVTGAGYVLGPAFIEYDRLARHRDRLITLATPFMRRVLDEASPRAVAILCRRYRDRVMCVHQERGAEATITVGYERGVSMPLFSGASSKAILAHLDDRALKRLYLDNDAEIRSRLAVDSWADFKASLRDIRQRGVAMTSSEVTPGLAGVAVPVMVNRQVIASMSLVMEENEAPLAIEWPTVSTLLASGRELSERILSEDLWVAR